MTAAILHIGREIDECFPRFRRHGYTIHCFRSAVDFNRIQQSSIQYDLVSSTDSENEECRIAVDAARKSFLVPAILFSTRTETPASPPIDRSAGFDHADYDLIVPADAQPQVWIRRIDELVSLGRRLRLASQNIIASSIRLRQEASVVIGETQTAIERAKSLREWIDVSKPIPNMLADRILKCQSCGENFVFSAGEQLLRQFRDAMRVPALCDNCIEADLR